MEFGKFSFVILFAFLQRQFCDTQPKVKLTGKNTFYVGDNLQLSCVVDQDVDPLNVLFVLNVTPTIWIDVTSCKFGILNDNDTSTYNTTCNSLKTNFTMIKYNLSASDDNTNWTCQIQSASEGIRTCVGENNQCTSSRITLLLHVPTTLMTNIPTFLTTNRRITEESGYGGRETTLNQKKSSGTTTPTTSVTSTPSSVASSTATNNTSANLITGSTVNTTNSTSTSPTIAESTNSVSNNKSTNITVVESTGNVTTINTSTSSPQSTTSNSTNRSKSMQGDIDIKVIAPAVAVPCGLLLIGLCIGFVILWKRQRRAGKNVHETPNGMAVQGRDSNVNGWKESLENGRAADKHDVVYTTPDGFSIYPGPAARPNARPHKDKTRHDVTDQYSRPYSGTYGYQPAYVPSTYMPTRAHTNRDKKHQDVTEQYRRLNTGAYSYQTAYVPSTYMSARAYMHKGKNYDN